MTVNQWHSGSTLPEIIAFLAQSSKLYQILGYVHYRTHKQSQKKKKQQQLALTLTPIVISIPNRM